MDNLPTFVVAGIPLIVIIIALVEESKSWGLSGRWLRGLAMLLGLLFAFAFQLATAMPATAMEWLTVVVVGLAYGLSATGSYEFIDKRFPAK